MRTPSRPTYLVSGAPDIHPSHENLRASGRTVRYDDEVEAQASRALRAGGRFVVVAHGGADGTVSWRYSASGEAMPWLWVGMTDPPAGSRIYVYACRAGRLLPSSLDRCECFGHVGDVPMPTHDTRDPVLRYLDEVDRLVADKSLSVADWMRPLTEFLDDQFTHEVESTESFMAVGAFHLLRKSLGLVDD